MSCAVGRCESSPHLGSFNISWSRPILKVVYVLLTLIPRVEGGFITSWHKITSWFCIQWHKILLVLVSQGSRALWAVLTRYGRGNRQGLLLTSHDLSFIQEISSSYLWLFHAKTCPLPRLPQDAKCKGIHYCFPWIPTKLLPVWELEINLSVGLWY